MATELLMVSEAELENELTETIALLEATIPANPASPRNERLANAFERELSKYFEQMGNIIPIEQIEILYYKNVRQD